MRSRRIVIGAAVAGAAAAVLAATAPALAFPGFTLDTNGNTTTAQIPYLATATSNLVLNDITAPTTTLTCAAGTGSNASTASGNVNRGTSSSNLAGTVTATKFGTGTWNGSSVVAGTNPCLGASQRVAFVQTGTWAINVGSATSGGVTQGSLSNIKGTVYVGTCSFQVAGSSSTAGGSVSGSFTNGTGSGGSTLTVNASGATTLKVYNTSVSTGCAAGAIKNGDNLTFGGTYNVKVNGGGAVDPIRINA